jgi:TRAP transporter TAXI family solute receptor
MRAEANVRPKTCGVRMFGAALALTAGAVADGCVTPAASVQTRPVIRLVRASDIGAPLAAEIQRRLPEIELQLVDAEGSVGTLNAIQRDQADLGFMLGDVAYFSYMRVAEERPPGVKQLRGMAALQLVPIHLLVRPGLNIRDVSDLRGYRVGAGTALSIQTRLSDLLFRVFKLGSEVSQPGPRAELLSDVDAAFRTAYYPAPNVYEAALRGARLVPIDGPIVAQLQREYPFVQSLKIPANTYPNQPVAVKTIGVDRLLVCRADLDEALVHDLTRHFIEALPVLTASVRSSIRLTDLELTPATTIPLHKGAAQFYRERELSR